MRNAFVDQITKLAEQDERIWLITGDLGFSVLEDFANRFPERFINAGIAEQNMMGLAAGLAQNGAIPFVYSIANFPIMRCLEQVRNDVCYHNLPVKIVTVGGGFTYAAHGYTHLGIEDLAVMRALPNMSVIAPGDPAEAELAIPAILAHDGPCFLRLGRAGETRLHQTTPNFALGKAVTVRPGTDGTIMAVGSIVKIALEAANRLQEQGKNIAVLSMASISPIDHDAIIQSVAKGRLVTLEEHGIGGLASSVSEVIAQSGLQADLKTLFIKSLPPKVAGSDGDLRQHYGLDAESVMACFN